MEVSIRFQEAVDHFTDRCGLDRDKVENAYRDQSSLLVSRERESKDELLGFGCGVLVCAVACGFGVDGFITMLQTGLFADGPYISVPIAILCGLLAWGSSGSLQRTEELVKADVTRQFSANEHKRRLNPPHQSFIFRNSTNP